MSNVIMWQFQKLSLLNNGIENFPLQNDPMKIVEENSQHKIHTGFLLNFKMT